MPESITIEFTEDELRHLKYIMGGASTFENIAKIWSSQSFLTSLFAKLSAAEKYMNKRLELSDGISRSDVGSRHVINNN